MANPIAPYKGPFDFSEAAHLLRRTLFGPSIEQIQECVSKGLDATLETLFTDRPMPGPPLNYYDDEDIYVKIGETWIDKPYAKSKNRTPRKRSLKAWTIEQLLDPVISIREKMVLFWHNHFVVSGINDPRFLYQYSMLLRRHALGNFKVLTSEMTIDPSMLRYLNGNQNVKGKPNENYARELLELFTIGKGPIQGPGDYTHYTEDDILEIARVLTGWKDKGHDSQTIGKIYVIFRSHKHDAGTKRLSHRFGHAEIHNGDDQEYLQLMDIIFQQPEVGRFIVRKLYRWFVYYEISDEIEKTVIDPLGKQLFDNGFNIAPVLRRLLASQHFFAREFRGAMVKNPLDYVISPLRQNAVSMPYGRKNKYNANLRVFWRAGNLGLEYYGAPSVAGWQAYYQSPGFYQLWVNASTLPLQMKYASELNQRGFNLGNSHRAKINVLRLVKSLRSAQNPDRLITGLGDLLFPQGVTKTQVQQLKEVLIPGLPDYEWTVEYNRYTTNPWDENLKRSIEQKLYRLMETMMSMPEYFLA